MGKELMDRIIEAAYATIKQDKKYGSDPLILIKRACERRKKEMWDANN